MSDDPTVQTTSSNSSATTKSSASKREVLAEERAPLAERLFVATPLVLGVLAILVGLGMAVFFYLEFNSILNRVDDPELSAAVRALQLTVVAVWFGAAFWGSYLVRDGVERASTNRRLNAQSSALLRIERALRENDSERAYIQQKSRSFWNWRRVEVGEIEEL